MGGRPCLKGTRFPVSQILEALRCENEDMLVDYCDDFSLDYKQVSQMLRDIEDFFELRNFEEENG